MSELSHEWRISRFSRRSLALNALTGDGRTIAAASGFLFSHGDRMYLVTNLHVVTGQNQDDGSWLPGCGRDSRPKTLEIVWPSAELTHPRISPVELYDDSLERVFHGVNGMFEGQFPAHDVAVIPLPDDIGASRGDAYTVDDEASVLGVTDTVFIVGYPENARLGPGRPPVWTRGSVASEPQVPGGRSPLLVDARTRPGQSGAPVIVYRREFTHVSEGGFSQTFPESARLVGIYSGRTREDSDLGRVWDVESIIHAIKYGSHWPD